MTNRFLAACRREPVDRPPVWIMRQAGRYLPEYRATRAKAGSFISLCRWPELASEVTLQPIRRFRLDAAIIFSDILLPLMPMGVHFAFPENGGPRIPRPFREPADWDRLKPPANGSGNGFVAEALSRVREELASEVALIGFCGAPWTLASYLIEGGTSRDHPAVKAAMIEHPKEFARLLDRLADAMATYLREQVQAGAQAVQIFDSWAGALALPDYVDVVIPPLTRLLKAIEDTRVPRIVYVGGGAHLLPALGDLPCEVVSVDWRTDLRAAAEALPGKAIQGNLDPAALLTSPDRVAALTARMLGHAPEKGYVANLGHGILPETSIESVRAFLTAVRGEEA